MLKQLHIRNVALVRELDLEFGPGLNVITGETGAGKSILIGAIGLALGDRAHPDVAQEERAEVQAELEKENRTRSLRREVRTDGRTKAWIDGESSTIGALREEGDRWIEITAQREGASLLDPETHLHHLDRYAGLENHAERLATFHARWQTLTSQLSALEARIERMAESEELARFQLDEIERFDPRPGEDEELEKEIRLLEGAESLIVGLGRAVEVLDQGEEPISDRLASVVGELSGLERIDPALKPIVDSLNDSLETLRTSAMDLQDRRDDIQLDPERLEELRQRHSQLIRLQRKYGGSMQSLLDTWEELKHRQSSGEQLEDVRAKLKRQIRDHLEEWEALATLVSRRRREEVPGMAGEMEKGLMAVGVEHPVFEVAWLEDHGEVVEFPNEGERRVGPWGFDLVEFRVSFNPGHEPKPLQRVASGGELSRVMLLLKSLDPPEGNPPVLIFDEIDTGISGKVARQVGRLLKQLSRVRQVLLVTHLPQIASFADRHIVIEKLTDAASTEVTMRPLPVGSAEQVEEVARLVGGETITDTARATARELIEEGRGAKV